MPAEAFLRKLCREGLPRRYREIPASAPPRLEKELGLIERLGFSEYFLVVWDIVQHARSRGTPVAGRGSGASSLAAYVLGLTNVCPLAYDIPFERFLHQGREDFPDLDIDFCWRIRDEVIEYVFRRWGSERVAMVCTHITFQERSCLRETAKAMGLSDGQISRLQEEGWNGQEADAGEDDAETRRDQSPRMSIRGLALPGSAPDGRGRIDGLARRLLGLPRNLSVHPGGVVIGRLPMDRYVPVQPAPKGVRITQYDKEGIEAIRLVKLDLLGNRNLSTVRYACDLVARRQGQAPSVEALPPADEATVALLRSADTIGCNQLESPAMRHLLKMMRPAGVADVMQALALIRPGAASIGMKEVFIRRHLGLEQVPPADGRVDSILGSTCGVMLYEDDVMLVAAALMGVPLEQADRFRKAVQKCRDDRQRLELTGQFLSRCRANGAEEACAKDLWVQMAKFNAYSFCRAHAASYALLAYAGAYLKAHHPLEFWTAALNNNQSMYHLRVYVEEAKRGGIRFLLPDANRSQEEFAVEGQAVRVGFNRVSGLGPASIAALLKARAAGAFDGLSDALCRAGLGRPEARALVLCGAFDYTGRRRPALMLELELAGRPCPRCQPALLSAGPTLPDATEDYSLRRKRRDQRGVLGFSVDEHVLSEFRPHLARMTDADSRQLAGRVGRRVRIAGLLEALRTTPARNGRDVTFLTLQDEYGLFEVTVFPGACRAVGPTFSRYGPYVVSGRVEDQYGAITVSADGIVLVPRAGLQGAPGADNRS
jgi:DNA-directed DNA polymerase III PolC